MGLNIKINNIFKIIIAVFLVISFAVLAVSCKEAPAAAEETEEQVEKPSEETPPETVEEPEEVEEEPIYKLPDVVTLTLEGKRENGDIIFYGTSNLPDGVLLSYEVSIPETLQEEEYIWEDGILEIEDCQFLGEVSNFPEGEVEVWVAFQTILGTELSQPQEVIEKYGEMGENINGENIYEVGDFKRIEQIITID
jgi:hypothetical protein